MSVHVMNGPGEIIGMILGVIIIVLEFLGAIIASTVSDSFIRWGSFGMVACGLFINYIVHQEALHAGIKKMWKEISHAIKSFFGRGE